MDTIRVVHINLSALIYRHSMFQLLYVIEHCRMRKGVATTAEVEVNKEQVSTEAYTGSRLSIGKAGVYSIEQDKYI